METIRAHEESREAGGIVAEEAKKEKLDKASKKAEKGVITEKQAIKVVNNGMDNMRSSVIKRLREKQGIIKKQGSGRTGSDVTGKIIGSQMHR